jgi:gamma-glutamylputrescine oxidase
MDPTVYWHRHVTPAVQPLRGDIRSEAVVVGGGIAGLTCAQALNDRGLEVTLVERDSCGAGASGKSSGFITPDSELELSDLVATRGESLGRELWEFARSGLEHIRRTISELALDCDYQVQDSLFVASSARAFEKVVEVEHQAHQALGYGSTLYDRSDLERILGARAFHGGIRYAGTFGIDSYAYCRGLRAALERRGVRIYEGTPALRIDGQGVETPGGRVRSAKVAVLADTGLPSLGLAPAAIHPVRTFLAISRPLRASQIEALFPSGDRLMVWDSALVYQYFRLTGEGRLLLGSARLRDMYASAGPGARVHVARKLQRYLAGHFRGLEVEFEYLWPGLIGVSKDFLPVVGRSASSPEVCFAGAAAGLPWAAALGGYLAQKLTEGRAELDAALWVDRPFAIGARLQRLLGKPAGFMLSHAIVKYSKA